MNRETKRQINRETDSLVRKKNTQTDIHFLLEQDLLGQVSRLRKREEQIPPSEWVGPEVR